MDEFDLSTLSVRPGAHDRFTDDLGKLPHLTHVEYNAVGLVDLSIHRISGTRAMVRPAFGSSVHFAGL